MVTRCHCKRADELQGLAIPSLVQEYFQNTLYSQNYGKGIAEQVDVVFTFPGSGNLIQLHMCITFKKCDTEEHPHFSYIIFNSTESTDLWRRQIFMKQSQTMKPDCTKSQLVGGKCMPRNMVGPEKASLRKWHLYEVPASGCIKRVWGAGLAGHRSQGHSRWESQFFLPLPESNGRLF